MEGYKRFLTVGNITTHYSYLSGPEVCRTEYISECWTKNDPHIVEDDVPKCRAEYEEKCVEKQVMKILNTILKVVMNPYYRLAM